MQATQISGDRIDTPDMENNMPGEFYWELWNVWTFVSKVQDDILTV